MASPEKSTGNWQRIREASEEGPHRADQGTQQDGGQRRQEVRTLHPRVAETSATRGAASNSVIAG